MERSSFPHNDDWGFLGLNSNTASGDLDRPSHPSDWNSTAPLLPVHGSHNFSAHSTRIQPELSQRMSSLRSPFPNPWVGPSEQYMALSNFTNPSRSLDVLETAGMFGPAQYSSESNYRVAPATVSAVAENLHDPTNLVSISTAGSKTSTPRSSLHRPYNHSRSSQTGTRPLRKSSQLRPIKVQKQPRISHGDRPCGVQKQKPARRSRGPAVAMPMQADVNTMAMICYLLRGCRSGLMPSNEEFQSAGRLFMVSPDALRERYGRITEDSGYQSGSTAGHEATKDYEAQQLVSADDNSGEDGTPLNTIRDLKKPFVCTHRCGKKYEKRASWERHEQNHYPQHLWVCHYTCRNRASGKPIWLREDHFQQHLIRFHHYNKEQAKQQCKASCLAINSRFPRTCHLPECSEGFVNWKDRLDHMASHMMSDYDTAIWGDLVDEGRENVNSTNSTNSSTLGETSRDSDSEHSDYDSDGHGDDDDDDDRWDDFDNGQDGPGTGGPGYDNWPDGNPRPEDQGPSEPRSGQGGQPRPGTGGRGSSHPHYQGHLYTGYHMVILAERTTANDHGKPSWSLRDLRLSTLRWLGSGATGIVDEVKNQGARETMARKLIACRSPSEQRRVDKESYIMHRLRHSHIVRLLSSFSDQRTATLFMLPAADYTLAQYMQTHSLIAPIGTPTPHWFSCLVSGMRHIHEQDIVHGDIKPENILIFEDRVFYSDFGLSSTIPDNESTISGAGFLTKQYGAPEIKNGRRGKPSDVWSLGCVFLELVTVLLHQSVTSLYDPKENRGRTRQDRCYSSNPKALAQWIQGLRGVPDLRSSPSVLLAALDCSEAMMKLEPKKRPTAIELAKRMPSHDCCATFECTLPSKKEPANADVSNDLLGSVGVKSSDHPEILTSNSMTPLDVIISIVPNRKSTSKLGSALTGGRRRLPGSNTVETYSPMLLIWLSELNSYEAFLAGYTGIYTAQSRFPVPNTLASLTTQLDSLSMAEAGVETQHLRSMTTAKGVKFVKPASSRELKATPLEPQPAIYLPKIINCNGPSLAELKVYSRATHTWVHVSGALDPRTRQDWVSEELVDKLGAEKEAAVNNCVYVDSDGQRSISSGTVQLRWNELASVQTRQNWFLVIKGSFDIVIGSDFLHTHGLYTFHDASLLTSNSLTMKGSNSDRTSDSETLETLQNTDGYGGSIAHEYQGTPSHNPTPSIMLNGRSIHLSQIHQALQVKALLAEPRKDADEVHETLKLAARGTEAVIDTTNGFSPALNTSHYFPTMVYSSMCHSQAVSLGTDTMESLTSYQSTSHSVLSVGERHTPEQVSVQRQISSTELGAWKPVNSCRHGTAIPKSPFLAKVVLNTVESAAPRTEPHPRPVKAKNLRFIRGRGMGRWNDFAGVKKHLPWSSGHGEPKKSDLYRPDIGLGLGIDSASSFVDCPHGACGQIGTNGFVHSDELITHLDQIHAPPARKHPSFLNGW